MRNVARGRRAISCRCRGDLDKRGKYHYERRSSLVRDLVVVVVQLFIFRCGGRVIRPGAPMPVRDTSLCLYIYFTFSVFR